MNQEVMRYIISCKSSGFFQWWNRSGGLYTENQLTDKGNKPEDDLMCVKLSPGKAYVRGFDVSFSEQQLLM